MIADSNNELIPAVSPYANNHFRDFSVVIPALNEERFIAKSIQSIFEYCGRDTEIIVVDNGSTDDTVSLATNLGVQVVQTSGATIGAQRNLGASHASGNIYAFLDADCTVLPGWPSSALKSFENDEVVAAGAVPEIPECDTTWVQRTWEFMKRRRKTGPAYTNWLPSANLWIRGSAFRDVEGFNESFESCEDADIGYRLSEIGKLVHDNSIRIKHHREPRNLAQFFRKEVWHGKNSFDGIISGRFTALELPSLAAPIWLLLSLLTMLVGVVSIFLDTGWTLFISGTVAAVTLPLLYSIRLIVTKGKIVRLPQSFLLYVVYFSARTLAMVKWISRRALK